MTKLLILVESPLNNRDLERFAASNYQDLGYDVYLMDLSRLVNPDLYKSRYNHLLPDDNLKIFTPTSLVFALSLIRKIRPHYTIDYSLKSFQIGQPFLSKLALLVAISYFSRRVVIDTGKFPNKKASVRSTVRAKIINFLNAVIYRVAMLPHTILPPYVYFKSGTISQTNIEKWSKNVVHAHNYDFDIYLNTISSPPETPEKPYLLFLDQNHVGTDDFKISPHRSKTIRLIDSITYYQEVNALLLSLSKLYGLEVVVAAHPRADLQRLSAGYDFMVISGSTSDLIYNCDLVTCHDSTSIQLAVLHRKPIIFLKTSDYFNPFYNSFYENSVNIDFLAGALGSLSVTSTTTRSLTRSKPLIHTSLYDNFTEAYIKTSNSPRLQSWQIVHDFLSAH